MDFKIQQQVTCQQYGVVPFVTSDLLKVGISRNVYEGVMPLNGLRYAPIGDTSGWYLWAGEELSQEDDFFVPLHIYHLYELVPSIVKYLLLPPSWRFLTVPQQYEDVWYDKNLLSIID
jgi:hypothetical protein